MTLNGSARTEGKSVSQVSKDTPRYYILNSLDSTGSRSSTLRMIKSSTPEKHRPAVEKELQACVRDGEIIQMKKEEYRKVTK